MRASLTFGDQSVQAEFSECILHTTGEFGGNIDFSVRFNPPIPIKAILQNLRLKLPATSQLLDIAGYGQTGAGYAITMYSELAPPGQDIPKTAVPSTVEVFWLSHSSQLSLGALKVKVEAQDE
jgi:hypothetical protein